MYSSLPLIVSRYEKGVSNRHFLIRSYEFENFYFRIIEGIGGGGLWSNFEIFLILTHMKIWIISPLAMRPKKVFILTSGDKLFLLLCYEEHHSRYKNV